MQKFNPTMLLPVKLLQIIIIVGFIFFCALFENCYYLFVTVDVLPVNPFFFFF